MIRMGTVIKEEGNGVLVRFDQLSACVGCNGCGREQKTTIVFVKGDAKLDDRISVQMPDVRILKASILMYLIPLLGFIFGLLLGNFLSRGNELWMVSGSFIGLIVSVLILKATDKHLGKKKAWQAEIIAVNPEIEQDDSFICEQMKRGANSISTTIQ